MDFDYTRVWREAADTGLVKAEFKDKHCAAIDAAVAAGKAIEPVIWTDTMGTLVLGTRLTKWAGLLEYFEKAGRQVRIKSGAVSEAKTNLTKLGITRDVMNVSELIKDAMVRRRKGPLAELYVDDDQTMRDLSKRAFVTTADHSEITPG